VFLRHHLSLHFARTIKSTVAILSKHVAGGTLSFDTHHFTLQPRRIAFMKYSIRRPVTGAFALATLALAATTAVPAFALTPAPVSASLRDAAATPIETVQQRTQAQRKRQRTTRTYSDGYRDGYNAYAAAPGVRGGYGYYPGYGGYGYGYQGYSNPWGHCVTLGNRTPGSSAFPDWDLC
jgi:hypothetical protein